MSARGYLFDNDVIIKLSQYGLLYELAEIFGNDFNNFYVLPTFEYVASFNKPEPHSRYFNTPESWVLAKNFFYQCSPAEIVDMSVANTILNIDCPGLDEGELILLGCAVEDNNKSMVTGDKRAVKAIDNVINDGKVTLGEHKIIVLEAAMLLLIKSLGFDKVAKRVLANPEVDKAVANCFGQTCANTEESAYQGLVSYLNSIKKSCSQQIIQVQQEY